ncbi:MAG: cadherin repeat domain-containing protein [Nanoarchaeota archaeon]|nr:cadherin repeat domain-containing protein [Nanoarchaeota archaeon]
MRGFAVQAICVYIFICAIFIILPFYSFKIHGYGITGSLSIFINGEPVITIHEPQNTTYFFSVGSNYTLSLNVSASSGSDIETWWYKLEDLQHSTVVYEKVIFTPNITFDAVRWSNQITVFANNTQGEMGNASVIFIIDVPNSPPVLDNITSPLLVCEDTDINYQFNVTDVDENELTLDLFPKDPFFVFPTFFDNQLPPVTSALVSGILNKEDVGIYNETLSVTDGVLSDFKQFLIHVIGVNHKPSITDPGVQTVWDKGDNSSFYVDFWSSDVEDGNESGGNLSYALYFLNEASFFSIDASTGIINWTATPPYDGVHNLTVCAWDLGLSNPHANISLCNSSGVSLGGCVNFSLTVTDENRAPYFVSYKPLERNLSVDADAILEFNVTVRDPDGTIPDIYWYVDELNPGRNKTSGSLNDSFNYSFTCNQGGFHEVKVEITDGLLNASLNWSVFADITDCPVQPSGGGGGGATGGGGSLGGAPECENKWVCQDWSVCQSLEFSYVAGNISERDYSDLLVMCSLFGLNKKDCGFQVRECNDLNSCTILSRPSEIQSCFYTQYPNCRDGIRNCHNSGCELLTDCGGPCRPCPTCSDGIKNQEEAGIDCGGPCPFTCQDKDGGKKKIKFNYALILITLLILAIVIVIIMKVIQIVRMRRESRNLQWYRLK